VARVVILLHSPHDGPGYLAEVLSRRGLAFESVNVGNGPPAPPGIGGPDALVLLGGRLSVHDPLPWIEREAALVRQAAEMELPILGHGFGAELIAYALGASVVRGPVRRIGWFSVHRGESLPPEHWVGALPASFQVFAWHHEAFGLPLGAAPLLTSEWCTNEAFARHRVLAFQGHLEVTAAMVDAWVREGAAEIERTVGEVAPDEPLALNWESLVQGPGRIRLNLESKVAELHRMADIVYGHWIDEVLGIR
jgi:GMP synthase-like glutamine amidotransferase